ncbi:PHP domain-containing protein [Rhizobium sp. TRM95111]|uniref:PHP domain-containing protein n=1 Tax=Rhizobium alarense TaxID=2846851 RepID=UPI001F463084|nr:PHP domain-containing protein [Rhizobium alarense]MCF3641813.1 PHP domain-containing protein [Rhizobium alarense]
MTMRKPVFRRFSELTPRDVNVELQVHTSWTDGKATSREVLETARARGVGALAFTEHVREDTDWYPDFFREIDANRKQFSDMAVYIGVETKAMDEQGRLDLSESVLAAAEIVLGSVHRFPDDRGGYLDFKTLSAEETAEIEFRLSMGMIRNAPIDVLAHPGGMYQRRHGEFPERYFREMMIATLERPVAIEINSSYLVNMARFIDLCREIDPIVSIGSDAHRLDEIGTCRDLLLDMGIGTP